MGNGKRKCLIISLLSVLLFLLLSGTFELIELSYIFDQIYIASKVQAKELYKLAASAARGSVVDPFRSVERHAEHRTKGVNIWRCLDSRFANEIAFVVVANGGRWKAQPMTQWRTFRSKA
ncbi:hypothetical protein GQX74_003896 [Glossina fuscipes]|nr:hypothetical protein GQX74_003896 [Glossina fuscipes]